MQKSLYLKIHSFILLALIFFGLFLTAFSGRSNAENGDPIKNIEIKSRLTCAKIKKKLTSARELYMVENPDSKKLDVRLVDIVKSGYLRFEPACPEGGKYSLGTDGVILCSKCDAKNSQPPAENANKQTQAKTAGTAESEVKKTAGTLESSINRYLNKDDAVVASIGEEQARKEKKETVEVSVPAAHDPAQDNFMAGAEELKAGDSGSGMEQIPQQEGANFAKGAIDFHKEAIDHARRGEVEQALEKFQKAIELVPASFTYHYNYALYLAKIESYDQSYVEFQRAMRLNPTNKKVKDMIEKLKKAISTK